MFITERDIEILKFINEFGYCEMPQIEKRFGLKKPRSYKVVRRLVDRGLLIHEYILRYRHGIYRLTKEGAELTDFPMLKYVSLGSYNHQITVVNVYLDLMKRFPDAGWVSERRLRREEFLKKGFRRNGHLADGILLLDYKKIAIEVELTMKGKDRLDKILDKYLAHNDIDEMWYFCSPLVFKRLQNKKLLTLNIIKIFNISN